jgi:excisionase family DNA binding protein
MHYNRDGHFRMSEPLDIDEILDGIDTPQPETISVEEAGRRLGIKRMAAYGAVWRKEIPSIRIGRRLLVPLAAFNALLGKPPTEDDERASGEAA